MISAINITPPAIPPINPQFVLLVLPGSVDTGGVTGGVEVRGGITAGVVAGGAEVGGAITAGVVVGGVDVAGELTVSLPDDSPILIVYVPGLASDTEKVTSAVFLPATVTLLVSAIALLTLSTTLYVLERSPVFDTVTLTVAVFPVIIVVGVITRLLVVKTAGLV
jgi:hypothetical protein